MLKRRKLVAGGVMLAALPSFARVASAQAAGKPILIFAGDETSEACKVWRTQWEPLFKQAPVFQKVDYRVVFTRTPALLMKPANWPSDLRWVLDAFLMSQVGVEQGAETPRFFLIQGGQITMTAVGNNAWRDIMWPTLLDVTNSKP
ncbi:hypothetical protein [Reyranella sp.]|uniref:hypothetical protein n=1 Tax=Reyranella sp. TaxID=1929291 RepID=UPI0025E2FFFD|nr:hypothetical protein [Reyranella sp.]